MTDSVQLHWTEQGEGPALIILHGLYGSGKNWSGHARWLAEEYRVVTPDLRNHGRSPHADRMDYPAMASDVLALMDRADCEQALVIGHSMGGKVAMTLALNHPERVSGLVVVDIAPVDYGPAESEHDRILTALAAMDLDSLSRRSDADLALQEAVPEALVRQFLLTNLERQGDRWGWRIPVATLQGALSDLADFPATDATYEGRVLFLRGADSGYQHARYDEAIEQHFPHAEQVAIADAGHWLHVEQPKVFASTLADWLRRRA